MHTSLSTSPPMNVDHQTKVPHKSTAFPRLASIQQEISEIDLRLMSLRSAEAFALPPSDVSPASIEEDPQPTAVTHMLAAEICTLAAANDAVGVRALLNGGADPDLTDYDMRTPLHLASRAGHVAVATVLLEYGADSALQDRDNKTALRLAEEGGHDEVVRLLLERAAPEAQCISRVESLSHPGSPLTPVLPDYCNIPQSMMGSLVVVMVGLPGRGKSYIAGQILRYFQWSGLQTTLLTYSSYREKCMGLHTSPVTNVPPEDEIRVAQAMAGDVASFLRHGDGVVVIDGTYGTSTRRMALLNAIKATGHIRSSRVVFVEVTNNDPDRVLQNVKNVRERFPDAPETFVKDYFATIEQYRAIYQPLHSTSDEELTYIHIEDEKKFSLNNVFGWMPTRLTYMLQNLSHTPSNIYLTCPGEYVDLVANRLGGNSRLTPRGIAYSKALFEYFKREQQMTPFAVMSSCALRCTETVRLFEKQSNSQEGTDQSANPAVPEMNCRVSYLPTLDDVNHGDCNGLLLSDVHKTMPMTVLSMQSDPYHTAWPNGECLHQVFNSRLEPHIHDMQGSSMPVLVVSHLHLLQGIYSYFVTEGDKFIAPQDAYNIDIPLECVVKIRRVGVDRVAEIVNLSHEVDRFCKGSKDSQKPHPDNCNVFKKLINIYKKKKR